MRNGYEAVDAIVIAERFWKPFGKHLHVIVFALTFAFVVPVILNPTWVTAAVLYASMLAGQSVGWGQYINGMINKKSTGIKEIAIIDWLILDTFHDRPIFANTLALSIRGLIWSMCITVGFAIIIISTMSDPRNLSWIPSSGLMMGPLYLLAMELCQRMKGFSRGNGWQFGEYFTGFFFWGTWAFLMGA